MKLRIHIDSNWTAEEFAQFFAAIQSMSTFLSSEMQYRFANVGSGGLSVRALRRQSSVIEVASIQFSSPGFTDIAGFGAVLSEIRSTVEFLIKHFSESEKRKDEAAERKLDLEVKRLSLIQRKIEILRNLSEYGVSQSTAELLETNDIDRIIEAIRDGRLTKVEAIDEEFR